MSVSTVKDSDNWTIALSSPATVSGQTVMITPENLKATAGTYTTDDIANASGVAGANASAALDAVELKADNAQADATAALLSSSIYADIGDILSASAEVGGVDGFAGTITRISVVPNNTIAVGDLVVTFSINGVPITDGVVTLPAATAALTRVATSPSALNVVGANDVISWAVTGGNTAVGRASIRIAIDPTTP